jgi:hypothetical protein
LRETSEEDRIKVRLDRIESQLSLIKKLLIVQIAVWLITSYGFPDILETFRLMVFVLVGPGTIGVLGWLVLLGLEKIMFRKGHPGLSSGDMERILDQFESAKEDKSG